MRACGASMRDCTPGRDRRDAVDARRLEARCPCCGGRAACRLRACGRARAGYGRASRLVRAGSCGRVRAGCERHCTVRPMKLTACTIISKPQNTGLLVNLKASYRRKQTRRASGWTAGAARRDGLATQRARRAGDAAGRRPAPARLGGPAMPVRCTVCVRRRWDARFGGLAARVRPWDAPVFHSESIFGAPISSFAMLMPCLPIFWALLQKNDPKFDVTPELLGRFSGTILCQIFPTWGNACARGRFSPFPPAKPPRSLGPRRGRAFLPRQQYVVYGRRIGKPRRGRAPLSWLLRCFFGPTSPFVALAGPSGPVRRAGSGNPVPACRVGPSRPELAARCVASSVRARPSRSSRFPDPRHSSNFIRPDRVCRRCISSGCRMRCSAQTRAGYPVELHRAWVGAVSACGARRWRKRRARSGPGRRLAARGARSR